MPSMPAAARASFTSSSLNGLMTATMSFMRVRIIERCFVCRSSRTGRKQSFRLRVAELVRVWPTSHDFGYPTESLRHHDRDVQILQLTRGDRRRALRHEVLALLRLRKCD